MRTKIALFTLLCICVLATSWAVLSARLFPIHDYVHVARIAEMSRALLDGQFPVRWSSNFGYGYGMPLFEFYAPLPYFIGALLVRLGLTELIAFRALYVLVNAATVLGAYLLGKTLLGRSGGVLTAAAYTLAPYRAVNLFVRGALSESFAMMTLPWILYFVLVTAKSKGHGWIGLTLSLVGLFLSHNLVTLISIPFIGLWILTSGWMLASSNWREYRAGVVRCIGAVVLAVGLSSFYLMPAFLEKQFTKVATLITGGYFDYHLHFLYLRQFVIPSWGYGGSEWGAGDGISFFLGWGQLIGLLLTLFVALRHRKSLLTSHTTWTRSLIVLTVGLLGALAFTTFKTQFVWDAVPLFTYIQFPWRFLSIATLFVALGAAAFVVALKPLARSIFTAVILCLLIGNTVYFRPERYLDTDSGLYYTDASRIRAEMSGILPDFIPAQTTEFITDVPNDGSLFVCQTLKTCSFKVTPLVQRSHEFLASVELEESEPVTLAIAYFPGWFLEIDGKRVDHSISQEGLLQLTVPAGLHTIGGQFGSTPLRQFSDIVSMVALLVLMTAWWGTTQTITAQSTETQSIKVTHAKSKKRR